MAFTDHEAFNAMNHLATESDNMSRELVDATIQSMMDFMYILESEDRIDPLKIKRYAAKYRREGQAQRYEKYDVIDKHFSDFEWYNKMVRSVNEEENRKIYDADGNVSLAREGRQGLREQSKGRVLNYLMNEIHETLTDAGIDIKSYQPPLEKQYFLNDTNVENMELIYTEHLPGKRGVYSDDDPDELELLGWEEFELHPSGKYDSVLDIIKSADAAGVDHGEELPSMKYRREEWIKKFGY